MVVTDLASWESGERSRMIELMSRGKNMLFRMIVYSWSGCGEYTVRSVILSFFVMYFSQGIWDIPFSISRGFDTINVPIRIRTLSTSEFNYKYLPMMREQHIMRQNCSFSTENYFNTFLHTL